MISYITEILGTPPQGLEFLEYIFAGVLLFIGIYIVYKTISLFFSKIL